MKSLVVLFLFVTTISFSQNSNVNLSDFKAYKIALGNLSNQEQAINIAKTTEKELLSEFSWIDFSSGVGYFIVKNNKNITATESYLRSLNNINFSNTQEIRLEDNLFLELYSKKSGIKNESLQNQIPDYINLASKTTSELFYQTAKEIWSNKYPENYKAIYNAEDKNRNIQKDENTPEHYPVYINTGNPDYDNSVYDQAKKEWIINYPGEVEQLTGRSYEDVTGLKKKEIGKK